uniref:helix-turn-helix domain-containing protein n=1 Tax=Lachnospira sp. TaxID=2049031 RepID=UPI003FF0BDB4
MDNVNLLVADNLKRIRISKGWSQSFVANQLGIAQRTISRAECGCGVSKRTLEMLCSMYQVSVASIYGECVQENPREVQVVPDDVAVGLLIRNSFIKDLEQEVIRRYTDTIGKQALMLREDVERIIPEALSHKKSYTLADVITACMVVNQKTLSKIRKMAVT